MSSTRKLNVISEINEFEKFRQNYRKKLTFSYSYSLLKRKYSYIVKWKFISKENNPKTQLIPPNTKLHSNL